jgi:FtsK/SpoIIIE family
MNRPRHIRRHARRMRRYGLQPMMIIGSNDQLPETAAVLLSRWIWRHRSEFAPLFVAGADIVAGLYLHAIHPGWRWYILAGASLTAPGLLIAGRWLGLASPLQRVYAAAIALSDGLWLSIAAGAGPLRAPLPQVLATGGIVLAIPWWASRRRRARVRIERKLEAWPEIAQAVGLAGSRVMSAVVDVWGWHARFGLARGQTIADVIARLPAIESALGAVRGAARAYPTPDNLAHRFELRVLEIDPHAEAIPWPGPSATSVTEPIDLGPFEDAAPVRLLLLRRHALIGGTSGSGKSGVINVLMATLSACSDVVIWAIDLKRGMELQPWASCIGRLATTPEQARAMLHDAVTILEGRAEMLTATGRRVWEPTPDMPALVIIIDEYAELSDDAPEAMADSDSIARRGRAVAVTLIAATQRPTQKAMGRGAVRSQMDVRLCFRVRERKDVDLILGQGMLTAGWHAHMLNAPGKFLISAPEHDTPRRARAYLLTDDMVSAIASRHADLRPNLDEISRLALDRARAGAQSRPGMPGGGDGYPENPPDGSDAHGDPAALLRAALSLAPDDGISVPDLMAATKMSRPWVYQRLRDLANRGQVTQVGRGRWRAVTGHPE